jgi:putative peptidoglycan lipid II flippase
MFVVFARPVMSLLVWGNFTQDDATITATAVAGLAWGMIGFSTYLYVLRGFYALERTRTVFFIQCAVAATNIVVAVALVRATDAEHTAPALVLAYTASYVVGLTVSYLVLQRSLAKGGGSLATATTVRFLVRLLVATGVAAFASWGTATVLPGHDDASHLLALLRLVLVGGANVLVFLVLARLMRLTEVNEVIDTVTRRLRRPSSTP